PKYHVTAVEEGGEHWDGQLVFRDALRSDPDERRRYDDLKRRLAAEGHSRDGYTELKTPLIRAVEAPRAAHRRPAPGAPSRDAYPELKTPLIREVEARARARGVAPTS